LSLTRRSALAAVAGFIFVATSAKAQQRPVPLSPSDYSSKFRDYVAEAAELFVIPMETINFVAYSGASDVAYAVPSSTSGVGTITLYPERLEDLESDIDENAVRYVLFHETAHLAQFRAVPAFAEKVRSRDTFDARLYELMADCAAGYGMAARYEAQVQTTGILPNYGGRIPIAIAELSDYDFGNPTHHGTVTERATAFGLGGAIRVAGIALNIPLLMGRLSKFEQTLFLPPGYQAQSFEAIQAAYRSRLRALYQ
jgi:hypothetical protein